MSLSDPFAVTADPALYVPRPASEAALAALEAAVRDEAGRPCVLTGPAGIGKSMLLRVLEQRVAGRLRSVFLPYAALDLDDLARWALGQLGFTPARHDDCAQALLAVAEREKAAGRALLLILDDASALPPGVARALVALGARGRGALRLLVAPVDDGRAGRVLGALGREAREVRLREPLREDESAELLRGRLARAGAPAGLAARFDPATLQRLHIRSGGNPRRLIILAGWRLRKDEAAPPGPRGLGEDDLLDALELPEDEEKPEGGEAEVPPGAPDAGSASAYLSASDLLESDPDEPTPGERAGAGAPGGPGAAGGGRPAQDTREEALEERPDQPPASRGGESGADEPVSRERPGRPAAIAAAVVLLALALIGTAWCLGPRPPLADATAAAPEEAPEASSKDRRADRSEPGRSGSASEAASPREARGARATAS